MAPMRCRTVVTPSTRSRESPRVGATQVWDLYRIGTWAKSGHGEKKLLIVHHVLSILVWPLASLYRVAGPFLLHYEYTELSPPISAIAVGDAAVLRARFKGGQDHERAVCAVVFRGEKYERPRRAPRCLFSRQYSLALHPELPLHVRLIGAVTAGLPALLNLFWTLQILKMGKKMLFPKPKRPSSTSYSVAASSRDSISGRRADESARPAHASGARCQQDRAPPTRSLQHRVRQFPRLEHDQAGAPGRRPGSISPSHRSVARFTAQEEPQAPSV